MELTIICPHCNEFVIISKLNCGIFRHCVFIKNGKQVPPHTSKEKCNKYIENKQVYGCGKPFKINKKTLTVEICDYD